MNQPEIILNLWYVCDEWGFIYSLRARAYIGMGSDEEKLAMLQKFAQVDYLIARIFTIPAKFRIDGELIYHKDAMGCWIARSHFLKKPSRLCNVICHLKHRWIFPRSPWFA